MSTVCVTGGSGFIASWIVKCLLHRGYTVNATVLHPNDPNETQHLLSLDGAKERLQLFKADLMEEGSFDAAIAGCDGVFHSASPLLFHTSNPQEELLDPALKGTLNVLGSVAKTPSVKRVVLTSSEAAIAYTSQIGEAVIDETCWSDPDYCRDNQMWYILSKRLAEPAAWDFAKQKGIDLVSINPGCVIGPMLQPTLNASCSLVLDLVNGSETYTNTAYGWVHVKDVADAHVLAYEKSEANGRYYVVERCADQYAAVKILRELYPTMKLPQRCVDVKPHVPVFEVNNQRSRELGVVYTPLEEALKDTVESLKEKGHFKGT